MAISTAAFDDGSDGASKATFTPGRNPNIGVQYGTDYSGIIRNHGDWWGSLYSRKIWQT